MSSIEDALNQAEIAREEMKKLQADNEKIMDEARAERDKMLKEAREIKEQIVAQAKSEAEKAAAKVMAEAEQKRDAMMVAAMADIKNQVLDLSLLRYIRLQLPRTRLLNIIRQIVDIVTDNHHSLRLKCICNLKLVVIDMLTVLLETRHDENTFAGRACTHNRTDAGMRDEKRAVPDLLRHHILRVIFVK